VNSVKYDYSKLLGHIRSKNITHEKVAQYADMGTDTFSGRINNKSEFRQKQILDICECLGIPLQEIPDYFFCKQTS